MEEFIASCLPFPWSLYAARPFKTVLLYHEMAADTNLGALTGYMSAEYNHYYEKLNFSGG